MNRVGEKGKGESVWLGWFLYATLTAFAPLAEARGETSRAPRVAGACRRLARLRSSARPGTAIGTGAAALMTAPRSGRRRARNAGSTRIAQSWAVISGPPLPNAPRARWLPWSANWCAARTALALLFTPPFDKTRLDPGYIKGYPPGVRENGGQYTHAAMWSVMAFAKLGEGDKAAELFSLLNPINHARTRADVASLQGRALCGRRRHLFGGAARRTRRLDLVHGLGGMDVARRDREHPRSARSGPVAAD